MAKRKSSNKQLVELTNRLKSQTDKSTSLEERVNLLETELRDSLVLISSMIEVNKELLARQKSESSTPTDDRPVSDKDSTNTILKKIYTFFVKGSERDKRNYELQRDREQEQIMESRRRKSSRKATATKIDPKKPSSNPIMDLLGFVGSGIAGIFKFVTGGLFGIISKGISSFVKLIKNLIEKIPGGSLITGALTMASNLVGGITNLVMTIITKSAGLIWKALTPFVSSVIGGVTSILYGLITGIASLVKRLLVKVLLNNVGDAIFSSLAKTHPAFILAGVGLDAMYASQAIGAINDFSENALFGEDVIEKSKSVDESKKLLDVDLVQEYMNAHPGSSVSEAERELGGKEGMDKIKKERFNQWLEQTKSLKKVLLDRYEKITPIMKSLGYEPYRHNEEVPASTLDRIKGYLGGYGPTGLGQLKSYEVLGFRNKETGETLNFADTQDGPWTKEREDIGVIMSMVVGAGVKLNDLKSQIDTMAENDIRSLHSNIQGINELSEDHRNQASRSIQSFTGVAPSTTPTATPTPVTPVAPSTTSSSPPPQPPPISPPRVPSSIPSLIDSDYMESGEATVINNSSQSAVSNEESDYGGTPNVRNPNPIVYRTAMFNDQALARL